MVHGLYNGTYAHEPWVVQCCIYPWSMDCTILYMPMTHGLYTGMKSIHIPWSMGCTMLYISMAHGLYNTIYIHDPWIVQWYVCPWAIGCTIPRVSMAHGLYTGRESIHIPWSMGCTILYISMTHGVYNATYAHGP